ncbi:glycosyltransferase family 2 protein [Chloroflexota bacterium]
MDLSVIVVNWNTRDLLAFCLESLADDPYLAIGFRDDSAGGEPPDGRGLAALSTEIFVVDNASTDGSPGMVRERYPFVRLIELDENIGFARANNRAIRQSQGRYVVLLNSDTEVHPGALGVLANALDNEPDAGAAGPRVLNPDGSLQPCYGSLPSLWSEILGPNLLDPFTKPWGRFGRRLYVKRIATGSCTRVDQVSFACTAVRRETFLQEGLLDERFPFYSEDDDWFKRLNDAGWQTLFCPQAVVVHHWGASARKRRAWAELQLYRGKRRYYLKHHGILAERLLRAGLVVRFLLKYASARFRPVLDEDTKRSTLEKQRRLMADTLRSLDPIGSAGALTLGDS